MTLHPATNKQNLVTKKKDQRSQDQMQENCIVKDERSTHSSLSSCRRFDVIIHWTL